MDMDLMERKVSFGEAETELDEAAISSTYRAGGGFIDGNLRYGLPDLATARAAQSDVNTTVQINIVKRKQRAA